MTIGGKLLEGQAQRLVIKKRAKREPIARTWLRLMKPILHLQSLTMQKRLNEYWDRGKARKEVGIFFFFFTSEYDINRIVN